MLSATWEKSKLYPVWRPERIYQCAVLSFVYASPSVAKTVASPTRFLSWEHVVVGPSVGVCRVRYMLCVQDANANSVTIGWEREPIMLN